MTQKKNKQIQVLLFIDKFIFMTSLDLQSNNFQGSNFQVVLTLSKAKYVDYYRQTEFWGSFVDSKIDGSIFEATSAIFFYSNNYQEC